MTAWRIHHKEVTQSTNIDACAGSHGDVYTADFQTAGRGRLNHKWSSRPCENLAASVVLSVASLSPDLVVTLPLAVGLAVVRMVQRFLVSCPDRAICLKWPNDVLVDGRKIAGILCERHADQVIVGIGLNVNQCSFPSEIADAATSLALITSAHADRDLVLKSLLDELDSTYAVWRQDGFLALHAQIVAIDALRGHWVAVRQTDADTEPIVGICGGIQTNGSLDVGGESVYAGEAHVESVKPVSAHEVFPR